MQSKLFNIKQLENIADGLYAFFGDACEIVIHDLKENEKSIIYVKGNLTGRKVGDSTTNIVIEALKADSPPKYVIANMESPSGKSLKSLSIFIESKKNTIGCICVIIDTTHFGLVVKTLTTFLSNTNTDIVERKIPPESISKISEQMIDATIQNYSLPVSLMKKEDKTDIVLNLERQGIFLLKGAVDIVAKKLNVSRYTIYNYLDEIKSLRA